MQILWVCFSPQPGWIAVNPQSITGNKHKCCMSFQSAPYWDVFQLFQWLRKGQYPLTCEENHQTFLEHVVTKARTVGIDVGGGI